MRTTTSVAFFYGCNLDCSDLEQEVNDYISDCENDGSTIQILQSVMKDNLVITVVSTMNIPEDEDGLDEEERHVMSIVTK